MKIAVVGIGVAGAYLMDRLSQDHDNRVMGFERMHESQHDAVCAWATSKNVMSDLAKNCGLNFEDYIMHSGKHMKVDLKDISTADKEKKVLRQILILLLILLDSTGIIFQNPRRNFGSPVYNIR